MKIITNIHIFKTPNDIRIYKALWDTGATESLISSKVIKELGLEQTGEVELSTME
jgi:predicted aspartyl protease